MEKVFNWFGGRKTTFAILLFIVVSVILFADKTDFEGWSNFIIWVFGVYAVGNGAEHLAKGIGGKKE